MSINSPFNRLLVLFFVFIAVLLFARIIYSGNIRYAFLIWNLFLAWIPYCLSGLFVDFKRSSKWKKAFIFFSWLLFFPNALYIVTDLIHLQQQTNVPMWYDVILLFTASFTGLILAFASMLRVEKFLTFIFSKTLVARLIPMLIFLGSFGVYLGRFQRWNSWDVINNPIAIANDIISRFILPHENLKTWSITLILTVLFSLLYSLLKIIPHAAVTTDRYK